MESRDKLLTNASYLSLLEQMIKYFDSKKIKQVEIVNKAGISKARVSKILNKKEVLSMNEFMNIAEAFDLHVLIETDEIIKILKKFVDK